MYYLLKFFISGVLVVLISEISKRNLLVGAFLASMPIISYMSFLWIYLETRDVQKVADLSINIFWLILPSMTFFLTFPYFLKIKVPFVSSLVLSSLVMFAFYGLLLLVLRRFAH